MLFNSFDFLIFLPIVFVLYWHVFDRENKKYARIQTVPSYYFF